MFSACPGIGCRIWEAAAGDYDEKVESDVCGGCTQCGGNPPKPPEENAPVTIVPGSDPDADAVEDLFDDIESIVEWENAGFATDWMVYPFEYSRLFQVWRNAEREVATIQTSRLQVFIKSWFKEQ